MRFDNCKTKKKCKSKKLSKNSRKEKAAKSKKADKTQKAGKSLLGKCNIFDLPNNNVKLIIGRRRYYTKNFDINPIAKKLLQKVANDPLKKNKCIAIARKLDEEFRQLKIKQKNNK